MLVDLVLVEVDVGADVDLEDVVDFTAELFVDVDDDDEPLVDVVDDDGRTGAVD